MGGKMGEFGIGQPVPRIEDPRLLDGRGQYGDDFKLANQCYGYILRSPHANAKILSINVNSAKFSPGVLLVLTGEDWLKEKFKNHEFNFFLVYRFIGGIPLALSNILPTIFNIKIKNFFFGSLIGMYPQLFIWVAFGSGLHKITENNLEAPSITQLLFSQEVYIPLFGFIFLIILGIIIKNIIYKN